MRNNPPERRHSVQGQGALPASRLPLTAFTLVELLTAIAILAIIVAILFQAFNATSNALMRNQNKIEVNQTVRAVMDVITRDLERIEYNDNVLNLYQPDTGGAELIPDVLTNTLYMLSDLPVPEPNCLGSYVNVGYQISQTNVGGFNKWVLMRGDDSTVVTTGACSNHWWDFSFPGCGFNAVTDTNDICYNPGYWKVLSENVIGIYFDFYTNAVLGQENAFGTNWNSLAVPNPLPYSVGVGLYAIDTDTYNKALRVDPTLASAASRNLITTNMRLFYTRVFLPQSTQNP